jgi:hypothetical protein
MEEVCLPGALERRRSVSVAKSSRSTREKSSRSMRGKVRFGRRSEARLETHQLVREETLPRTIHTRRRGEIAAIGEQSDGREFFCRRGRTWNRQSFLL